MGGSRPLSSPLNCRVYQSPGLEWDAPDLSDPQSLTSGPAWRSKRAGEPVAQLVEHETFNLGAVGSNPTGLTIKSET
jgi:hypothetical protein